MGAGQRHEARCGPTFVTYQNRTPGFAEDVPYVLALVELEEGVKMFTNIVDCNPREGEHRYAGGGYFRKGHRPDNSVPVF